MNNLNRRSYKGKNNPFFGKAHSEKSKDKISKTKIALKKVSPIKGKKMDWHWKCVKNRKNWTPWNKGKKNVYSKDVLEKMRISHLGSKSSLWKGGVTKKNTLLRASSKLKAWRLKIFKRDNFTCQNCESKKDIQAHHIKAWSSYPRSRYIIKNGITLCEKCHRKTNNFGRYSS